MQIMDQQTDRSQAGFLKIAATLQDTGVADFIKKRFSAFGEKSQAPKDKFADAENKRFPVDTPENTILSKLYFDHQKASLPEAYAKTVGDKLKTFATLHGIPFSLFAKTEEKTAAAPPRFSLLDGIPEVSSAEELSLAGQAFEAQHAKLAMMDRVSFSKAFMKAAEELDLKKYPQAIAKYAACLDTDLNNVRSMLEYRAIAAQREGKDGSGYRKLASAVSTDVNIDGAESLEKLAQTIHALDEHLGFDAEKYDRKFPDAYSVVFCKQAEDAATESTPTSYTKEEIVRLLGDEALVTVTKDDGSIDQDKAAKLVKTFIQVK